LPWRSARRLVGRVVGFSPSVFTRERALSMGVVDAVANSAAEAARGADLVLVAVPVAATESTLAALAGALSPSTLVMDVGSTKCDVVAAAERALGASIANFVPAHPIAGKEVAGVEHADPALYQGCQVILTPGAATGAAQTAKADALWRAWQPRAPDVRACPRRRLCRCEPSAPLAGVCMMNAITSQADSSELLSLAGPGFRDFTRIAASDPAVWRDIFLANRDEVLAQIGSFQASLTALQQAVAQSDPQLIQSLIHQASTARSAWHLGAAADH